MSLESLTFGIELEMVSNLSHINLKDKIKTIFKDRNVTVEYYNHDVPIGWKLTFDSSIHTGTRTYGIELVSPILKGEKGLLEVSNMLQAIEEIKECNVNSSCGFHVHVGGFPNDIRFFKNLIRIYSKYEEVIDTMMPPSRRRNNNEYCKSIKNVNFQRIYSAETIRDINIILGSEYNSREFKYLKLNLLPYWRQGTVEFRQHSGTLNCLKIISWIKLCLMMVNRASSSLPESMIPGINPLTMSPSLWAYTYKRRAIDYIRQKIANLGSGEVFSITQKELNEYFGSNTWGSISNIVKHVDMGSYEKSKIFGGAYKYSWKNIQGENASSEWKYDLSTFFKLLNVPPLEASIIRDRVNALGGNNVCIE